MESENLTTPMKEFVRARMRGAANGGSARTRRALAVRGLLDEHDQLTEQGRVHAISVLPLNEQCEALEIDRKDVHADFDRQAPEVVVQRWINDHGGRAHFTENTFGVHVPYFFLYPVYGNTHRRNPSRPG